MSSYSAAPVTSMLLLLLIVYLPVPRRILSQSLGNSPSGPTVAQCGPRLLPLTSCAPFVQGRSPLPLQQCCDGLGQLSIQQPSCLCLLLNGTALTSLPINTTRAMQLPLICNLQANISNCPGVPVPLPPTPQVSFGTANSTVAASPMATLTPRPNVMGFGFRPSAGVKPKPKTPLLMAVAIVVGVAKACMSTSILS